MIDLLLWFEASRESVIRLATDKQNPGECRLLNSGQSSASHRRVVPALRKAIGALMAWQRAAIVGKLASATSQPGFAMIGIYQVRALQEHVRLDGH